MSLITRNAISSAPCFSPQPPDSVRMSHTMFPVSSLIIPHSIAHDLAPDQHKHNSIILPGLTASKSNKSWCDQEPLPFALATL